jgi:hypothetical protein
VLGHSFCDLLQLRWIVGSVFFILILKIVGVAV